MGNGGICEKYSWKIHTQSSIFPVARLHLMPTVMWFRTTQQFGELFLTLLMPLEISKALPFSGVHRGLPPYERCAVKDFFPAKSNVEISAVSWSIDLHFYTTAI